MREYRAHETSRMQQLLELAEFRQRAAAFLADGAFTHGRTPGERLFQIRVVSLIHERITLWHSVAHALGYGAAALEFGFGFAQFFFHPRR